MPSHPDYREPVRLMSEAVGPATAEQRQLAAKVGLTLDDDVPRAVAAALLEEHLEPAIRGTHALEATDRQREFLDTLGSERATQPGLTRGIASAWIDHILTLRNIEQLIRLQPSKNDAVIVATEIDFEGKRMEFLDYKQVSSVGSDGLIYFKGGNGQCARPYRLTKASPSEDSSDYPQSRELATDA